jgi:cytochrome P450
MSAFIDLSVSIFDPEFTLNPYPYLEELYPLEEVLGFSSEGMDFLFRHEDCKAVLKSPHCRREPLANPAYQRLEEKYAQQYPNRSWEMSNNFSVGEVDVKLKSQLIRFLGNIQEAATFDEVDPMFQQLSSGGDLDNYVEHIATLPLQMILEVAGLPVDGDEIRRIYDAGCTYLKSFENLEDETLIENCESAIILLREFVDSRYSDLQPGTLIYNYVRGCKECGLSDDKMKANIIGPILISASNTMGISSAFFLRNLICYPEVRKKLWENPQLLDDDNVILEFLRRDNHVKALSRHTHDNVTIRQFQIPRGDSVSLFFPGANLDPNHWQNPMEIDFNRNLSQQNHIIFGGARHVCIGKAI